MKGWKQRFFSISRDRPGLLEYFEDAKCETLLDSLPTSGGVITVKTTVSGNKGKYKWLFFFAPKGNTKKNKSYPLAAATQEEQQHWVSVLQDHGCLIVRPIKKGTLIKANRGDKKWAQRHVVLYKDKLTFYKHENDEDPAGELMLPPDAQLVTVQRPAAEGLPAGADLVISVLSDQDEGSRTHYFGFVSKASFDSWMTALVEVQAGKKSAPRFVGSLREGYLLKMGRTSAIWNKRYFVLTNENLTYYKKKADMAPAGQVLLPAGAFMQTQQWVEDNNREVFVLRSTEDEGEKTYRLSGDSSTELKEWVDHIRSVVAPKPIKKNQDSLKEGYLYKTGSGSLSGWSKRFFVLTDMRLTYYKKRWDAEPAGSIDLPGESEVWISAERYRTDSSEGGVRSHTDSVLKTVHSPNAGEEGKKAKDGKKAAKGAALFAKGNAVFANLKNKANEKYYGKEKIVEEDVFDTTVLNNFSFVLQNSRDEGARSFVFAAESMDGTRDWAGEITAVYSKKKVLNVWPNSLLEGYLYKGLGTYSKRYFALFEDRLVVWKKKLSAMEAKSDECLLIGGTKLETEAGTEHFQFGFSLLESESEGVKKVMLFTNEHEHMQTWVSALTSVISRKVERLSPHSIKEGFLYKSGSGVGGAKGNKRYFVLLEDGLSYYKNVRDASPSGTIALVGGSVCEVKDESHHPYAFTVASSEDAGERSFLLWGQSEVERSDWVGSINSLLRTKETKVHPSSVKEGYLYRATNLRWLKRYFVLFDTRLEYYKKKSDSEAEGVLDLPAGAPVSKRFAGDSGATHAFIIEVSSSEDEGAPTLKMSAQDNQDWASWSAAIEGVLHKKPVVPVKAGSVKEGYLRKRKLQLYHIKYVALMKDKIQVFRHKLDLEPELELAFTDATSLQATRIACTFCLDDRAKTTADGKKSRQRMHLQAKNEEEMRSWMAELQKILGEGSLESIFGGTVPFAVYRSSYVNCPDVVVQTIEALKSREALTTEGIFRVPGNNDTIQGLQRQYELADNTVALPEHDVHSIAGVLKLYFRMLQDPLIPFDMFQKFVDIDDNMGMKTAAAKAPKISALVQQLPAANKVILTYLVHFLSLVDGHSEANLMPAKNTAMVFAPSLLRTEKKEEPNAAAAAAGAATFADATAMMAEMELSQNIIQIMISAFSDIFGPPPSTPPRKPKEEDTLLFQGTLTGAVSRSNYEHVPTLVVKCVEHLSQHALTTEGLFRVPGNNELIQEMCASFEGEEIPHLDGQTDVHSVAGVLKLYFRKLFIPLIPFELYDEITGIDDNEGMKTFAAKLPKLTDVLNKVDPDHYTTLNYLIHFLAQVVSHSEVNKMHAKNCAMVFAPSLIRKNEKEDTAATGNATDPVEMMKAANVMMKAMEMSQNIIEVLILGLSDVFPEGAYDPTPKNAEKSSMECGFDSDTSYQRDSAAFLGGPPLPLDLPTREWDEIKKSPPDVPMVTSAASPPAPMVTPAAVSPKTPSMTPPPLPAAAAAAAIPPPLPKQPIPLPLANDEDSSPTSSDVNASDDD